MSLDDQPINWSNFYQAYTGLKFSIHKENDCRVFVPTYTNIGNIPVVSGGTMGTTSTTGVPGSTDGTEMTFRDEWSSQSFLVAGETEYIDEVLLRQLWEYAESNILWDDFKQQLSFQDIEVEEITLYDFVKDIDTFLIFHKLSKFGEVWWANRVVTDGFEDNSRFTNVTLSTTPGLSGSGEADAQKFDFWSADKYVNDEYKKYLSDPSGYQGFLTNSDFLNGGWFTIPDLVISTKPFEKLKIANILLNLKFTFDPDNNFGHYYTVKNVVGARLKDGTSTTILDESQAQNSNNNNFWADNVISHWVGGLISTDNIQNFGVAGNFPADTCSDKADQINYETEEENPSEISHLIEGQMTLKPDYDVNQRAFLGTIDPINWRSTDLEENVHEIGILNVDRAFGGANGTRDNGIVAGGITTNEYTSIPSKTKVLSNAELWSGNGFLKNILPSMNTPRCYHVQGGTGRATCGVIGGYSEFNTENAKEFSEWSKTSPMDSLEVFISSTDPTLSYFQTVSDLQLNIPRGDHAGHLAVESFSRQDKFEVESLIKNFDLVEDDEQVILEFVNQLSGDTSNYIRYALSNVEGIVYGGTTTGRSNLISRAEESYVNIGGIQYDEVIDIFEKINTTYLVASENTLANSTDEGTIVIDAPQEVVKDVLNIAGEDTGVDVTIEKCGKYRLEYINGGFQVGASPDITGSECQAIVSPSVSVDMGSPDGAIVTAPGCGYYRATLLNNTVLNSSSGDERPIEESFSIPGWDDFGPTTTLPYAGTYRIEGLEFGVEDPDESTATTCYPGGATVSSSDPNGTDIVFEACGLFRVTYAGGEPVVDTGGTALDPITYYACNVTVTIDGNPVTPTFYNGSGSPISWDQCFSDLTDFNNFFNPTTGGMFPIDLPKPYFEFCVEASASTPALVNITFDDPCDDDLSNNSGNVSFGIQWQGVQSCPCNFELQECEVIVNDNLEGIAFTSSDEYTFCVENADSELRMRYRDNDYNDNSQDYGSVVARIVYVGPDCISATNPGGVKVYSNGIYVDTIFTGPNDLLTPGTTDDFCVINPESELKFIGDGLWGGQVNFELCYVGENEFCNCQTENITGQWAANTSISINGQSPDLAFDAQADSLSDLEALIESRPSDRLYDFCVQEPGSTLTFSPGLELAFEQNSGSINTRLIYLGESNCNCDDSLGNLSTDTATVESREVTIKYVTVEPNLRYPLRCHGMVYTGDNESGLSTGGRTEYNNMGGADGVISRIFDKYSSGYDSTVPTNIPQSELEKDRVLDLVYELNEQTWVRRQNMLESVYWHCGVGDKDRSLFWGGVHDGVGSFEVTVGSPSVSGKEIDPDSFTCPDSVKTFDSNTISLAGTDYVPILSGGPCWETPIWESFDPSLLFSDPRYRNNQETLQYSLDEDYPPFKIISVAPTNPAPIAPQDETNINVDHNLNTTIIALNKTVNLGGTFRANAEVTNTSNTTTGTMQIKEADIVFRTETVPVYPSGIVSITGNVQEFEFTNVQVFQDLTVELSYRFRETMSYDTATMFGQNYLFSGVGVLTFQSMQDLYEDIKAGNTSSAIDHTFKVLQSSENPTPFFMEGVVGNIEFDIEFEDGFMIGVTTKDQEWSSSLSDCGPNIADFIELVADFTPIGNQRWGVPIWTQGLYEDVGTFSLSSDINRRDVVSGDANFGSTYYEETTIDVNANTYGAVLNGRVLMKADTISQDHLYTAMNGASIPVTGETDCISASSNFFVSFPPSAGDNSYTEWGTSFIQEYQSDQRYRAPLKWVPSNGFDLKPSNAEIGYDEIAWRRYMDGVGLGGDVPVYDTIYDSTLQKLRDVAQWTEMNKWHVGQMCFGEPDAAIIVGGHKVDDMIPTTGVANGYHSGATTPRVFVWDLRNIPEEDEFLKNYMGRRMHTQFPTDDEVYSAESADAMSTLSITIYQAESDIIIERHGTVLFDGSSEASAEFDTPFPDDVDGAYQISLTPSENVEVWWEEKSNSGFTVKTEVENFAGSVDFIATAIVKVTEEDIAENDPLDGYIFDK